MDAQSARTGKMATLLFVVISLAISLFVASQAMAAAPDDARLASQYAAWAGGRANADALVRGLRNGTSIAIVTPGADRTVSLAGFTPPARLTTAEVASALGGAKSSLSRLGISRPTADQIQAALIGGEVSLASGKTKLVRGSIDASAAPPPSPVAITR